jgi:hypothetical protein
MAEGADSQNQPRQREEKSVRKSDRDTCLLSRRGLERGLGEGFRGWFKGSWCFGGRF